MLSHLRVRGLAVLEDAELELPPGLSVLTGETGAGKSLIVGGLALIRGARSARGGEPGAEVEAEFVLDASAGNSLAALLDQRGLPPPDTGSLLVQRSVGAAGRSRCFVQGRATTLPVLAEIGSELIEITSQHEHQTLTSAGRQLALLDAFAGIGERAAEYQKSYRRWSQAENQRQRLEATEHHRALRAEVAGHQLREIDELAPKAGELASLEQRVALLARARHSSELAREVLNALAEHETATLPRVSALSRRISKCAGELGDLTRLCDALDGVSSAADHALRIAELMVDSLDVSPGELEQAEARLSEIKRLCRKHSTDAEGLSVLRDALAREIDELARDAESLVAAEELERELEAHCRALADELHAVRAERAADFELAIQTELAELCLADARVRLRVERSAELGPHGVSLFSIELAANPGSAAAPLSRVASGGELSRLLLALRSAVTERGSTQTFVFDEVDAGVGGRAAEAIGVRLAEMARHQQVICITHLPQIAAFAEAHFRVEKHFSRGRSATSIERLDAAGRVVELARMLGGSVVSARAHAAALLEDAHRTGRERPLAHSPTLTARVSRPRARRRELSR